MLSPIARALRSLDGLSVGDALGEQFFLPTAWVLRAVADREPPPPPWPYTDDTEMAVSIVSVLRDLGRIDSAALAASLAARCNPRRGYGPGAYSLLRALQNGGDWRRLAPALFDGEGSYGSGAAARVAPVGAFFAYDLEAVVTNAEQSAHTTHAHPEGGAGAVAIAVAAALAWRVGDGQGMERDDYLRAVAERVPRSSVREGIENARHLPEDLRPREVAEELGAGEHVSAQDTVPYVMWCAAGHLEDYAAALWATVSGLGDRDTTCAMVGGIVALSDRHGGIPPLWLAAREPVPVMGAYGDAGAEEESLWGH